MIANTITSLKRAEASLVELLDISGRGGPGMLMDLADWWTNESIVMQIGGTKDYYDDKDFFHREAAISASQAKSLIVDWKYDTKEENLDWALEKTMIFLRDHLQDCILFVQQAIQILEEEMNNE